MDVRIGLADTPRELNIELADDASPDDVKATIESSVAAGAGMVWLTDKRGRQVGFSAAKVAYVEVGSPDSEPRIGFG